MSTVNELRHVHFLLKLDRVDDAIKFMRLSKDPAIRAFPDQFHDGTLSVADFLTRIEAKLTEYPQAPTTFVGELAVESPPPTETIPAGNGYAPIRWTSIIFVSILLSSLSGAFLTAWNWRRLGRPGLFPVTLIGSIFVILSLMCVVFTVIYIYPGTNIPLLVTAWLVPGVLLALWQRPAFNGWTAQYSAQCSMLKKWSGFRVAAVGICFVAITLFSYLLTALTPMIMPDNVMSFVVSLLISVTADRTFENETIRLTYPGGWYVVPQADYPTEYRDNCNQPGATCPVTLGQWVGGDALLVTNLTDLRFLLMIAGAVNEGIRDELTADGAKVISQQTLQVDGREAFQTVLLNPDHTVGSITVVKTQSITITFIELHASSRAAYDRLKPDVDAIIASMEFITPE